MFHIGKQVGTLNGHKAIAIPVIFLGEPDSLLEESELEEHAKAIGYEWIYPVGYKTEVDAIIAAGECLEDMKKKNPDIKDIWVSNRV
jgi:hypothetical protein